MQLFILCFFPKSSSYAKDYGFNHVIISVFITLERFNCYNQVICLHIIYSEFTVLLSYKCNSYICCASNSKTLF